MSEPNNPLHIKNFCEALINYQLYQALNKHDQHNQNKALSHEEMLSELRDINNVEIISETGEAEYAYQRSSLSKMYYNTDK
jgi:hypothetical protein